LITKQLQAQVVPKQSELLAAAATAAAAAAT